MIVGRDERPLYETDFTAANAREGTHFAQFALHSSLDLVDELKWKTKDMYLKRVDGCGKQYVLAFVTAGNTSFLLLTEKTDPESARPFFNEVYELYVRTIMNPFYHPNSPITSPVFDARVRKLAQKILM